MSDPRHDELSPLKRALLAIERLQDRVRSLEGERRQPLAVVGMGCRFPAGTGPEAYFDALRQGRDAIRDRPPIPRVGWQASQPESAFPFPPAGYLDHDVAGFDPGFFGISPREAASIDPQQRLLMEVSWEALEHAAIDPHSLEGTRTGVFVGLAGNDYAQMQIASERARQLLNPHFASGIGHAMASGRIAYLLGLHGPAITVDTACSSSLVAVHLACQSLRAGESDLALAAGTNLILTDDYTLAFEQSRMLAPDGRCKSFDAGADGFGRGEGCGVVVLKRLDDARRDGDRVLALVRGSAVNQDGPSSGLTAPNGPAQEAVIRGALESAGLTPDDVGYVEVHGTGTTLGDPIEAQALGNVFAGRSADQPLLMGSVKTNMGHLEAAAGIAGLIKVVQSLRYREIPPHLHFRQPSPHIPWEQLPLAVPTAAVRFEPTGGRRRAGVSSFGFSGTNAHVILEEAPDEPVARDALAEPERPLHLLALSAQDPGALRDLAGRFAIHLAGDGVDLPDLCFTANTGRAHFSERLAIVAPDRGRVREALDNWIAGKVAPGLRVGRPDSPDRPSLAFLYTGQGAQHPGMAWQLYETSPVFRGALTECAELLRDQLDVPLLDVLNPSGSNRDLVHRTDFTQPALFAVQHALTELWASWGIHPDVVLGHSIGEFAAARVAGVFSLEDALRVVAARGRLMHSVERAGRMLAVMAPEERVGGWVEAVGGAVSVAAVNAPNQVVVSGGVEEVGAIEAMAREAHVETKALRTSHAFHSPLMDGIVDDLEAVLRGVELAPASRVRFVSTVTGQTVAPHDLAAAAYWAHQLRRTVRFADAVTVAAGIAKHAVEIGPHPALAGLIAEGDVPLAVHHSLHRERDDWGVMLDSVGALYVAGAAPTWAGVEEGRPRRRIELPAYPFQRTSLWVDLGSRGRGDDAAHGHPLLGIARRRPGQVREFERGLSQDDPPFIREHQVQGRSILPGTAYIEMMLAAGREVLAHDVELHSLDFLAPMTFTGLRRVFVAANPDGEDRTRIEIHSVESDAGPTALWTLHATGYAQRTTDAAAAEQTNITAVQARCPQRLDARTFYASLGARGYDFGPRLKGIQEVWVGPDESLARLRLPEACAEDPDAYHVHPLMLDAALQAVGPALGKAAAGTTFMPVAVERVSIPAARGTPVGWAQTHVLRSGAGSCTAHAVLLDERGFETARIEGVVFREVAAGELAPSADPFLYVSWLPEVSAVTKAMTAPQHVRTRVAECVRATLRQESQRERAKEYDLFVEGLEARAGAHIVDALRTLGWSPETGTSVDVDRLATELGVVDNRRLLLARSLDVLTEDGFLETSDGGWKVLRPLPASASELTQDRGGDEQPPEWVLLERCGPNLANGLRGIGDPLELLFPGGDASDAERMYHDTPPARIFNRSVAEAVAVALESAVPGRRLRVLEIGGGTGGTTRRIVERLARNGDGSALQLEYTFTDVSPLFVERARRRFDGQPGMVYGVLDLDLPLLDQGFDPASYDLVVAANCLHAARDISVALRTVAGLLRPGGLLLAVEVFAPHRWFDLTVGLTDGWWHLIDKQLRGRYPCIGTEQWRRVLADAGFEDVEPLRLADVADGVSGPASRGQGLVLAARSDSVACNAGPLVRPLPWLVVTDDAGLGVAAAALMRDAGTEVVTVAASDRNTQTEVRLRDVLSTNERWGGVLHCGGLSRNQSLDTDNLKERLHSGTEVLLAIARLAMAGEPATVERVCVVTRGAQVADDHDADVDPAGAAIWGLSRTWSLEAPDLPCLRLDLDAVPSPDDAHRVVEFVTSSPRESERAVRGGRVLVPRLTATPATGDAGAGELPADYRLGPPTGGSLDKLAFAEGTREAPGPGQVEIRVAATGLNFKDVLNVLGMYPGDPGPLGSECAGVVSAVGPGVDLVPGTPVVAVAGHAFGKHVIADASLVVPRPDGLSFAEAATLPVAYLTAHFALNHLGRLGAGDRVLIHAAAGGVGMAACALALRAGAEIYATAGTHAKRELLRSRGIPNVFDSRSGAFAKEILAATDGAGVDVVLNSLADDLVDRSFDVIARGGRFLEIGKRGIWSRERVHALGRDIEYHIIDWGRTHREDPRLVGSLFEQVMNAVGAGELAPLPATRFPVEDVTDAFRYMANAKHVGKVILTHPVVRADGPIGFDATATYLVTGGTSGLGLETARWAAGHGAETLVLAARGEPGPESSLLLNALREQGVAIHVHACDVGDSTAVARLVAWIRDNLPPLRGVIHSAGALADRTLANATWGDFDAVFRSKVFGPAFLAEATTGHQLDFFVGYSSIASVLGSPGQGNHAAANAFLDAFAATRWRHGTTGVSIAWGPWSQTGAATRDDTLERTGDLGLGALQTHEGLARLAGAFASPRSLLVGTRVDDPDALAGPRRDALLELLRVAPRPRTETGGGAGSVKREDSRGSISLPALLADTPAGARRGVLMQRVKDRVRTVLGLGPDTPLDPNRPLGEFGLDSLLAVELRNAIGADAGRRLPTSLLFDHPTVTALTDHLLPELSPEGEAPPDQGDGVRPSSVDPLGTVEALSDDDVDRLLAEKLGDNG